MIAEVSQMTTVSDFDTGANKVVIIFLKGNTV